MRILLAILLLLVGGTYTFSQPAYPFGSQEAIDTYIDQNLSNVDIQIEWTDTITGEWFFFTVQGSKPEPTRQATAQKVKAMLKAALDKIPEFHPDGANRLYRISYNGWMNHARIFYNRDRVLFSRVKNTEGEWIVPSQFYDVKWEVNPLMMIPLVLTNVTHGRLAEQNDDGTLKHVYDTLEDAQKPVSEIGLRRYPPDKYPYYKHRFHIRYAIAASGAPGLLTLTSKDTNGVVKTTFVNLQDGEVVKPLDVKLMRGSSSDFRALSVPPHLYSSSELEVVKVFGNPEKDLVIECTGDLRAPCTWENIGEIPQTTIGYTTFYRAPTSTNCFVRLR